MTVDARPIDSFIRPHKPNPHTTGTIVDIRATVAMRQFRKYTAKAIEVNRNVRRIELVIISTLFVDK
jgi:hypothetical protein